MTTKVNKRFEFLNTGHSSTCVPTRRTVKHDTVY